MASSLVSVFVIVPRPTAVAVTVARGIGPAELHQAAEGGGCGPRGPPAHPGLNMSATVANWTYRSFPRTMLEDADQRPSRPMGAHPLFRRGRALLRRLADRGYPL